MVDMLGYRRKIGLLIDASNTIAAPDAARMALTGVTFHTSDVVSGDDPGFAVRDAAARIREKQPHGVAVLLDDYFTAKEGLFDSVSGTMNGASVIDPPQALVHAIERSGFSRRAGLVSPFAGAHEAFAVGTLKSVGIDVVRSITVRADNDSDDFSGHAHTTFAKLRAAVDQLGSDGPETILQLGHNLPLLRLIDNIEEDIGKPVLAINQVCLWYALRSLGIDDVVPGFGRLLIEC